MFIGGGDSDLDKITGLKLRVFRNVDLAIDLRRIGR